MRNLKSFILSLVVGIILLSGNCHSEENAVSKGYLEVHYSKSEFMIPMRDGTRLLTAIYSPRDTSEKYPILFLRTPYGIAPYGEGNYPKRLGPSDAFVKDKYIFAIQDVRGRFASEGKFEHVRPHLLSKSNPKECDESSDTFDTIEWMLQNVKQCNGRVGMYGISYSGFYASAGMVDAHPALRAVSPQGPIGDWYFDDFLHNGAFFLAHGFSWLPNNARERTSPTTQSINLFNLPSNDGYRMFLDSVNVSGAAKLVPEKLPFLESMMIHPNRDSFWQERCILPHLNNVAPAVMVVGGWYDAEDLYGTFQTYYSIERQNPTVNNFLVVGPWNHGGWADGSGSKLGSVGFDSETARFYRESIEFEFFQQHLKDRKGSKLAGEAIVFETGTNSWRVFDAWPPKERTSLSLYLRSKQRLSKSPPISTDLDPTIFISNPSKPVPFTEEVTNGMPIEYMVEDQRFASRRPDVVSFAMEPTEQDIVVAGPLEVDLWVSTSGTDADWIVKIIDEYPDSPNEKQLAGSQILVRSEVFRGRFRDGFESPKPFKRNEVSRVRFKLQDILHNFRKGHRLVIQIQSSWFPLVDRNPQKFVDNIYFANLDDFEIHEHRIYHSNEFQSRVVVGILDN
jgi:putative CocE/NonD family hydrolase